MKRLSFIPFIVGLLALGMQPKVSNAQIITTVAGVGLGDDSLATRAELMQPVGITRDNAGNTYVCDQRTYKIRKISPAGIITTIAGNGNYGNSGDGGQATNASVGGIYGLAVDKFGNLFMADIQFNCIRKVNTSGIISTIAGNSGVGGYSGDGGPATAAELNNPVDIVCDTTGNIIFTDLSNSVVRKINTHDTISTIVGDGSTGTTGDGGPATASELGSPFRVAMDRKGNLYVAEVGGNFVCKVDTGGIIHVIGGTGTYGLGACGDGGPATDATMSAPCGLAVDTLGNVYFADIDNDRIRKIDMNTGIISAYAASTSAGYSGDGGPATAAQISTPEDLVCDEAGNLYICDANNNTIRKVSTSGIMSTFAGQCGLFDEGVLAANAEIGQIANMATDAAGNLYMSDFLNNRVRKLDAATGKISTVAGCGIAGFNDAYSGDGGPATAAHIFAPTGVAVDNSGNIYVADNYNDRIRKVSTSGIITTVAGNGINGFGGDNGPATNARLNGPNSVAVDSKGNLYIADQSNQRIRKVDTSGIITTIAGNGTAGFTGDGGLGTFARLNYPTDVALDGNGNVYIADYANHRIRKVDTTGNIFTVAGSGGTGSYAGDGGSATAAKLNYPYGIKIGGSGVLFIADAENQRVRVVDAAGKITTMAGTGVAGFSGDLGAAVSAKLNVPTGVALDNAGYVYIADDYNYRVRRVAYSTGVTTLANEISDVSVYPNPVQDKITVEVDRTVGIGTQIVVYDMSGRVVYQAPMIVNRQTVSMHNMTNGVYLVQIKNKTGECKVIKVVKE